MMVLFVLVGFGILVRFLRYLRSRLPTLGATEKGGEKQQGEKLKREKELIENENMGKNSNSFGFGAGIVILTAFVLFFAVPFWDITVIDVNLPTNPLHIRGDFYSEKVPTVQYFNLANSKPEILGNKRLDITVYDTNQQAIASYYFFVNLNENYKFKIPRKTDESSVIGLKLQDYKEVTIGHFKVEGD